MSPLNLKAVLDQQQMDVDNGVESECLDIEKTLPEKQTSENENYEEEEDNEGANANEASEGRRQLAINDSANTF